MVTGYLGNTYPPFASRTTPILVRLHSENSLRRGRGRQRRGVCKGRGRDLERGRGSEGELEVRGEECEVRSEE